MREPTVYEQLLVELINRARADPAAEAARHGVGLNQGLGPGTISPAAKAPLAVDLRLNEAAHAHSAWMLAADVFSHTGQGGSSVGQRVSAEGYGWNRVGENIAWSGTTGALGALGARIEGHHAGLFRSAGHRANMLGEDFADLGVGHAIGRFEKEGTNYNASMLTEVFARSWSGRSAFTGVVIDDRDNDDFYDIGEGLGGVTVTARGAAGTFTTVTYDAGGYSLAVPDGSYTVTFSGGSLGGTVTMSASISGRNVKLDAEQDDAGSGEIVGTAVGERLAGTGGADVIDARAGDDVVVARDGDDLVKGGLGDDRLMGGAGNDELRGAGGADELLGGLGDDLIRAGAGNDRVEAGVGADIVAGGAGRDRIEGGMGNDLLRGERDADVIEGGAGLDRILGGPGLDRFVFREGFGVDRLIDYDPAREKLDFSGHDGVTRFADLTLRQNGDDTVILDGMGGRVVLVDVDAAEIGAGDFVFA